MSKQITPPSSLIGGCRKDKTYVFLAGPIQGVHDWQREDIPDLGDDVVTLNPRRQGKFDYWTEQVEWETRALRMSDFILFWVPPEDYHVEGRDYAQTTKIELMENLARGKNIVLGIDPSIHTRRYLVHKFEEYTGRKCHDNLADCITELKAMMEERKLKERIFFTSDTHFGSQRALELSKRPFRTVEEMDWTMIERWNNVVHPDAIVFHLGDFGNPEMAKYLNGSINVICGNYDDHDARADLREKCINILLDPPLNYISYSDDEGKSHKLIMTHEPLKSKALVEQGKAEAALFGHIHGRQKIKKFGIDVGTDAHNFTPIGLGDVRFYLEAIRKGYYDEEVFA